LSGAFKALVVVTYLVRQLSTDAPARKAWLVTTLRDRYDRLHVAERQFVEQHWPGGPPGGPPPEEVEYPDPAPFRAWAWDPLFARCTDWIGSGTRSTRPLATRATTSTSRLR
jgi:hypothetical protein